MKVRESGMPAEETWAGFFDANGVLAALGCPGGSRASVVDFGAGYGTFSCAAALRTEGPIHAMEVDSALVARLLGRVRRDGLTNIEVRCRDFVAKGTGLPADSVDHAMLYNILHAEEPLSLLREAWRILRPGGRLSLIHWKPDPSTPRGPPLAMRPTPRQCAAWARAAGFTRIEPRALGRCAPHHFGLVCIKPRTRSAGPHLLKTTRLVLTPLAMTDAAELHALWTRPKVRRYLWDDIVIPRKLTDAIVRTSRRLQRRSGRGLWVARAISDGHLAGFGGYWLFPNRPRFELLYGIASADQGRGLGVELARALLDHGFRRLRLRTVRASTDFLNKPSVRVLESLGARLVRRDNTGGLDTLHYEIRPCAPR